MIRWPCLTLFSYATRPLKRGGITREIREIVKSGLFDLGFYNQQSRTRFGTLDKAVEHFLATPDARDPHPLFSMDWYRTNYPDVADAGMNPFVHFLRRGAKDGRSPSIYFDTRFYLDTYPDVAASRGNPLLHFLQHGGTEGRDPSTWFSTSDYLAINPDVATAGVNALLHYVLHGRVEGRRLSGRPVMLDHRYGMTETAFALWRARMIGRRPGEHRRSCFRELIVVQSGLFETCEESWAVVRKTAAALGVDLVRARMGDIERLIEGATHASLVLFVESGDRLDGVGLEDLVLRCPEEADLVVFDLFYRDDGSVFPVLQPGANPQQLRSVDSVFSRFAIRGSLARQIVRRAACDPRSLLLAALDHVEAETKFAGLFHLGTLILETPSLATSISEQRRQAVLDDEVDTAAAARGHREAVSVIICTKDNGVLLEQLFGHLTSLAAIRDIVVVSHQTTNLIARRTLERWATHHMVTIVPYPDAFNFSDQCNQAVAKATGELLLFLNDDIIGLNAIWLDRLIDALELRGVGIVGPRLLYPNECVQHAGMYLGFHGTAGHTMRHARLPDDDYLFTATSARDVSCVTGAVLLTRRSTFEDLGGFDIQLRSAYQDIDLCLRVRGLGQRVLYVPSATLLHLESVTVNKFAQSEQIEKQRTRERRYFMWLYDDGRLKNDRYHNSAYDLSDESLRTLIQL